MKNHITTKYFLSKLLLKYNQLKRPNQPWLTQESIDLLNQLIMKKDIGFEFGSGRSTKWLGLRCNYLYSVEHNSDWYNYCTSQINKLNNVNYLFANINLNEPSKSDYLNGFYNLDNDSVDFVLNDGKLRSYIANIAIYKLKKGGIIIIDNAERYLPNSFELPESIGNDISRISQDWLSFFNDTINWRRIWTSNGITSTLIMFKP